MTTPENENYWCCPECGSTLLFIRVEQYQFTKDGEQDTELYDYAERFECSKDSNHKVPTEAIEIFYMANR